MGDKEFISKVDKVGDIIKQLDSMLLVVRDDFSDHEYNELVNVHLKGARKFFSDELTDIYS